MSKFSTKMYTFEIFSKTLFLETEKPISEELFDSINEILSSIAFELNEFNSRSSLYRFHKTLPGLNTFPAKIFLRYLLLYINYFSQNNFLCTGKPASIIDIEKSLIIRGSDLVKLNEVSLNSSVFFMCFVLEEIKDLLLKSEMKSFLVFSENEFLAKGKKRWPLTLHLGGHEKKVDLENAAIILGFRNTRINTEKFSDFSNKTDFNFFLIESSNIFKAKYFSEIIKNVSLPEIFRVVQKNKLTFYVLKNNEIVKV